MWFCARCELFVGSVLILLSSNNCLQMTVNYNINPATISNSRIITFTTEDPIVAFCTRLNLIDPDNPDQVANFLDTPVAVRVDITDQFEILALLEDEEENFAVEAFECDSNNNRITEPVLKTQGSRVRLCVQPSAFTQEFGVVMKSVNTLTLIRGDVSDEIIVPDGVIKDLMQTIYECTPGETICSIDTSISNSFFYSRGVVSVQGLAWLQYTSFNNYRRSLIEIPLQIGIPKKTQTSFTNVPWNRKAQEVVGSIDPRSFDLSFEVEPSGTAWTAEVFFCDGRNVPLTGQALTRPRNVDDDIRVCFMPSTEARERGVYIREISSFFFQQEDRIQFAIQPTSQQADNTMYICNAGEPLCAIKTELSENFFNKNLDVTGVGEVLLQYGTEPRIRPSSARNLQTEQFDPTVDAGFAGRSNVTLTFVTDPTYVPPSEKTWQEKADEWWHETPLFLRIVYVMVAILAILILLCFLWAICCGNPFARKKTVPEESKGRKIFIQPVFVRSNNQEKAEPSDRFDDEEEPVEATKESVNENGRLENGPMTKAESARFAKPGDKALHESFAQIEPDYSKSPKIPTRRASTGEMGASKSPNPSNSTRRVSSKSPKPRRTTMQFENKLESPMPGKKSLSESPRRSSKSPKPRGKGEIDDSLRRSKGSLKSPRPGGLGEKDDSARRSKVSLKSPRPGGLGDMDDSLRRSKRTSNSPGPGGLGDMDDSLRCSTRSSVASPKPRRSKQSMEMTGNSARSMSSNKSPLPRRGSVHKSPRRSTRTGLKSPEPVQGKSPGEGRSDYSARSNSSKKTPGTRRRATTGDQTKIPDLPFASDL